MKYFLVDENGTLRGNNAELLNVKDEVIIIPNKIGDIKITKIDDDAFCCNINGFENDDEDYINALSNAKKVIIEDGIEEIGECVFRECTKLKEVIFPATLKHIGCEAFYNCDRIKKFILPPSVEYIDLFDVFLGTEPNKIIIDYKTKIKGEYDFFAEIECREGVFVKDGKHLTKIENITAYCEHKERGSTCNVPLQIPVNEIKVNKKILCEKHLKEQLEKEYIRKKKRNIALRTKQSVVYEMTLTLEDIFNITDYNSCENFDEKKRCYHNQYRFASKQFLYLLLEDYIIQEEEIEDRPFLPLTQKKLFSTKFSALIEKLKNDVIKNKDTYLKRVYFKKNDSRFDDLIFYENADAFITAKCHYDTQSNLETDSVFFNEIFTMSEGKQCYILKAIWNNSGKEVKCISNSEYHYNERNDRVILQLIKLTFEENEKENFRTKLVIAKNEELNTSSVHKGFGF